MQVSPNQIELCTLQDSEDEIQKQMIKHITTPLIDILPQVIASMVAECVVGMEVAVKGMKEYSLTMSNQFAEAGFEAPTAYYVN